MPTASIDAITDAFQLLFTIPANCASVTISIAGSGQYNTGTNLWWDPSGAHPPLTGLQPYDPSTVTHDWTLGGFDPTRWAVYDSTNTLATPEAIVLVATAGGAGAPSRPHTASNLDTYRPLLGPTTYVIGTGPGQIPAASDVYGIQNDVNGQHGDNSGTATVTYTFAYLTAPNPPATLTGPSGCHGCHVDLSWTAVTGATGYRLYRWADSEVAPTPLELIADTTGLSWSDTAVTLRHTYRYVVTAYNGIGEGGYSNVVTADACLDAPTLTGPTECEGCAVTLSWNASDGATGYKLYRVRDWARNIPDGPAFVPSASTGVDPRDGDDGTVGDLVYNGALLTATDDTVRVGQKELYQVVAYCTCGTSPASNAVEVVPCAKVTRQTLPTGTAERSGCC